jgi:DNA-binding response OmpR family regulator
MTSKIEILLIEDDADDVELLQESLKDNGIDYEMVVLREGGVAVGYLKDGEKIPHLIVMDFNLPKVHGRELLKEIKANSRFGSIPLLILSTSSHTADIEYAYSQGADNYMVKPATLEGIRLMVATIIDLASKSLTNVEQED